MTDYTKLVKALLCKRDDCEGFDLAFFDKDEGWMCRYAAKDDDAAAAIEELEYEIRESMQKCAECGDANIPKHGEWIEDTTTYAGPYLSNYKCSLCGKICGTWRRGLEPSELPNWCGNCGADMRKMEVQE